MKAVGAVGHAAGQVLEELRTLRKGRGVEADDIDRRVGPALRGLCGVEDSDSGMVIRRKLRERLTQVIDRCRPDQARLLVVALGLAESSPPRRYQERLGELARLASVDQRTVSRRLDGAFTALAELAAESVGEDLADGPPPGRPPWHTTVLNVAVTFDLVVPEVFETRRVRADQDGVREIELGMTLTPPVGWNGAGMGDLGVDLIHGGEMRDREMKARNRVGFTLHPPSPLNRGEEHEYAVRVKLPAERGIAPHYVCTPAFRCDRFDLRVRFAGRKVPDGVWRLDGVPPLELDDPVWSTELLTPNRSGEVHARFENLEPRLSYGIGWSEPAVQAAEPER